MRGGGATRLAYSGYRFRFVLLFLPLAGLAFMGRRLLRREEFLLALLFVLALSFATSAVSVVYDRYTVVVVPFLILQSGVVIDEWRRGRARGEGGRR